MAAASGAARKGRAANVCCVGDDDQSIYGWRGAEVDNILRFDKDFPGAKVIKLERNYRSTEHILGAAGHLIAHNEGRLGKTLFTDRVDPNDEKVVVHAAWDSEEEARAVGEEIEALQRNTKHNLNDMAILVRASFQMREFEDRFVTLGLNYRVIGGPRFYERMEIRDAMAYFRLVCQPADDLAFERIVNTPKRGLGDTTIRTLHDYARARDIPMLAAAADIIETDELKPRARKALFDVVQDFRRWQGLLENTEHTVLAEQILDESGYTAMWQADKTAEAPGRLENLKELIRSMDSFESMRGFLEHVALVMDAEQNEELDAVSIMTLHSAKGLEFETVFLPGWEEGLSHISALWMRADAPVWRKNDALPMSALPAPSAAATSGSSPTAVYTVSGNPPCPHASWMSCRHPMSKSRHQKAVMVAMAVAAAMASHASTRPNPLPIITPRPAGSALRPTAPMRRATTGAAVGTCGRADRLW